MPKTWWFDEEGSWQRYGGPFHHRTVRHTRSTTSTPALPASPLLDAISFVMYQMQMSKYCPHICCGKRSLLQWCSGCCPILSWINTCHLQVGRHWDVCLSRQSTSLSLCSSSPLPLSPFPANPKVKRPQELTTAQVSQTASAERLLRLAESLVQHEDTTAPAFEES